MSTVRRNIIANGIGRVSHMLVAALSVPVYVKLLGIEAYGLVGFFTTLQSLLVVFDFGMTQTVGYAVGQLSAHDDENTRQSIRDVVVTYTSVFLVLACGFCAVVWLGAPWLATHWFRATSLPPHEIAHAVRLMALAVACQWPSILFMTAMMALQHQVAANKIQVAITLVRALGAMGVLYFLRRTPSAFFSWQVFVALASTFLMFRALRDSLPRARTFGRFRTHWIQRYGSFARNMAMVSMVSFVVLQFDKILLSKLLSLEAFGYYSVAVSAAGILAQLAPPVVTAFYPRFCQASASQQHDQLLELYIKSSRIGALLLSAPMVMLVCFATPVLYAWTGDLSVAEHSSLLLSLLAIGYGLQGTLNFPYYLQMAAGQTQIPLVINAGAIVVLVPSLMMLVPRYGAKAAAAMWILVNLLQFTLGATWTHRIVFAGRKVRWAWRSMFHPGLAACLTGTGLSLVVSQTQNRWLTLLQLGLVYAIVLAASVLSSADIRHEAWSRIRRVIP